MAEDRRGYGDGSVYPDVDGNGWIASLELPRKGNGRRRRAYRRRKTEAAAAAALVQLRQERDRSGDVARADRSVSEAVAAFRQTIHESPNDNWMLGLIESGLGAYGIRDLTVTQCDDFLAECAAGEYGQRPIGKDHLNRVRQRLVGVLHNEMRRGTIERNVAEVSKMPKIESAPKERRALTVAELHQLLDVADGYLLVLVDLCGRNALRPAEARALRWIDINLDRAELDINGQMNRHNRRGPVKRASNALRAIRIDQMTIARLDTWRSIQEPATGPIDRSGFVVLAPTGKPVGRELFADAMQELCDEAGVAPRITPYELRHTAITHQADAGRSAWEIADWAGTSEAMISKTYRHRLRRVSDLGPADG